MVSSVITASLYGKTRQRKGGKCAAAWFRIAPAQSATACKLTISPASHLASTSMGRQQISQSVVNRWRARLVSMTISNVWPQNGHWMSANSSTPQSNRRRENRNLVGTLRCGVPGGKAAGTGWRTHEARRARCARFTGADGAARRPYQTQPR